MSSSVQRYPIGVMPDAWSLSLCPTEAIDLRGMSNTMKVLSSASRRDASTVVTMMSFWVDRVSCRVLHCPVRLGGVGGALWSVSGCGVSLLPSVRSTTRTWLVCV